MMEKERECPQFRRLPSRMRQAVEVAAAIVRRMSARRLDIQENNGLISETPDSNEVKHGNRQK